MKRSYLPLIPLLLVVFYVHIRGVAHYFEADDFCRIYQDGVQTSLSSLPRFLSAAEGWFYRPLFKLTYFVNWHLWRFYSPGYHLFSLGLHLANTLLIYAIGKKLFNPRIALVAGLIFSLHATNAATVLWFANTSELLTNLFLFTSVWFWIKYLGRPEGKINLWVTAFSYLLALFAKENALIIPILLVLVDRFYGPENRLRQSWGKYVIFAFIKFGYLILRIMAHSHWGGGDYSYKIGLNIPANIIGYMGLLFTGPKFLALQQELRTAVKTTAWLKQSAVAGFFVFGSVGLGLAYKLRKRFFARMLSPNRPLLFIAGGFVTSVIPFILLGNVDTRFLYLPSAFLGWAIGYMIFAVKNITVKKSMMTFLILGLLLSVWSIQTQIDNWRQAGKTTWSILNQTKSLKPNVEPGDTFYFDNLPDNYNGALIFRNCIDEALRMIYDEKTLQVFWNQHLPPESVSKNEIHKFDYTKEDLTLKE